MGQMKIVERRSTIIDTSVLINYLSVGRIDLLIKLSHRHMFITEEVHTEIIRNRAVLEMALSVGQFKLIKGRSSRRLRQEFPPLTTRMPTRWTNSYFVSTVGGAPFSEISQYRENQKHV